MVNIITLARLPLVALGTWAALAGDRLGTVTFGLAAIATDMADGVLARRYDAETTWGSNFDSFADFVFYSALLGWTYTFTPGPLGEHAALLLIFFGLYVLALVGAFVLRGTIAAHDQVSRTTATVAAFIAFWFIAFGYHEWMLAVVALFLTADLAHRLHAIVQGWARRKKGIRID